MRRLFLWFGFLFVVAVHPALSEAGMPLACEMPPALVTPSMSLTSAAAALTSNGGLNILALGSGSTVGDLAGTGGGPAYSRPDSSFPYRMQAALGARGAP